MVENISKDYLLRIQSSVNTIPTERFESIDRLLQLRSLGEDYVYKPLMGERGNGTVILKDMDEKELIAHVLRFEERDTTDAQGSYLKVLQMRGGIIQPFIPGFMTQGEIKAFVVNGQITIAREHYKDQGATSPMIVASNSPRFRAYILNNAETQFVLDAYDAFRAEYDIHYARIDFVKGDRLMVSEVEAINPAMLANHKPYRIYSSNVSKAHYQKYLDLFEELISR